MASDYARIRKENIEEYGRGERHLALLGSLYSDSTHFIYELLQNAEDVGATRAEFVLSGDRLKFLHDGRAFNEGDVRGLCGVVAGTKAEEDLTTIGRFGIGFKSVYAFTRAPEVHSGKEHFRIQRFVEPHATETRSIPRGLTTLILLPFDHPHVGPEAAFDEIAKRLRSLNIRTLLFLKHLQEIAWRTDRDDEGVYLREEENAKALRRVHVTGERASAEAEDETWIVFGREVQAPDRATTSSVEVAYLSAAERDGEQESRRAMVPLTGAQASPLFVSFATEKQTGLGFLVNGPYRTTLARDNVPHDDEWNATLVVATASLVVESLEQLKDSGLLSVPLLKCMPIRPDDFKRSAMFRPIYDAVAKALAERSFLPTSDGTHASAARARFARPDDLRSLLSTEQLTTLDERGPAAGGEDAGLHWLHADIKEGTDLLAYLQELGVKRFDPENLANRVTTRFFEHQDDAWMRNFYRFLHGQPALWRAPGGRQRTGRLRNKPFIRCDDGLHVLPFDANDDPCVYLSAGSTALPSVRSTLLKDAEVRAFFVALGLSEPDIVAQIETAVVPHYRGASRSVTDTEHAEHIRLIIGALTNTPQGRLEKLKRILKDTAFLRGQRAAAAPGVSYFRPEELYVRTPELQIFMGGSQEARFLSDEYDEVQVDALRLLGPAEDIRVHRRSPGWDGHVALHHRHGSHQRGLNGFDSGCSVEDLDRALDDPNEERSRFIWNCVAHPHRNQIRGIVETSTRQDFNPRGKTEVFSKMGTLLRDCKWLPSNGGGFCKPAEVALTDLPESYTRDYELARQLEMKGSDVEARADQAGVSPEDLETALRLGALPPEQKRRVLEQLREEERRPVEFPERPSIDPAGRLERSTDRARKAPPKNYAKRERSVRVSGPPEGTRPYLRTMYTNDDGQLVCQVCEEEMPFKKKNGKHYFEAVQLFSSELVRHEHEAGHAALCPICAAKFKEFISSDKSEERRLRDGITDSELGNPDRTFALALDEPRTIRFVERHFMDVAAILEREAGDVQD